MENKKGEKMTFGNFFKEMRIKKGLTLRAFCNAYSLDPGNISKLERGRSNPPESLDILKKYAAYLGISEGSKDWHTFVDLASAEAGKIPPDIMTEREQVSRLPVLFRTLRKKKLTKADLDKLIGKLKDI